MINGMHNQPFLAPTEAIEFSTEKNVSSYSRIVIVCLYDIETPRTFDSFLAK